MPTEMSGGVSLRLPDVHGILLAMENLIFNLNEVYREILNRMEEQGSFDEQAYYDLVEEVLEEKREMGELSDDDNIEEFEDKLRHRWTEAKVSFETGHDQDVLEQE